jgi:hypothetical protein
VLGSVDPATVGNPALTDRVAGAGKESGQGGLGGNGESGSLRRPTTELPPLAYPIPNSLAEVFKGTASFAGYSAVSTYLECPEKSRLRWYGVRRKPFENGKVGLSPMAMGTVVHCLRAVRIVHGVQAQQLLLSVLARELLPDDVQKIDFMFRIYENLYPHGTDPWEVIGVETEVVTDIAIPGGAPVLRSVRYDTIVRAPDGALLSFEAKTAARGGAGALDVHNAQCMSQCALWNGNAALVAKYGTMKGVLFDHLIKTDTPKVERVGPRYFSRTQQALALAYLRLPETTKYEPGPDGKYPRMLHACWGRYSPCDYVNLCHEEAWGDFEVIDRATGDSRPYEGD